MATITLKGIPEEIHRALKERARRAGRSLNREVLAILSASVRPRRIEAQDFLLEVRREREKLPGLLTDDLLEEARRGGRP